MAAWLAKRGHEVRAVTALPYYPAWQVADVYKAWRYYREELKGFSVWRCPLWVPKRPNTITRLIHLLSFAISSLPIMIKQMLWGPNIIFAVEPPLICAPTVIILSRLIGAKSWLHVQDFEVEAFFGLGFSESGLLKRILVYIESFLMQRFDHVSTISNSMLERIHKVGVCPNNTSLFPNWVNTKLFNFGKDTDNLRKEWNIDNGKKIVLYAGNMGKKQGLEIVLEVANMLQSSRPDIIFLFVGDGVVKKELIMQAKNLNLKNVIFKPVQPLQLFPALLASGDVHLVIQRRGAADAVMPSKLSGILASGGAAIITADTETELGKFIENNPGIAIRVEPENPNALLSALIKLIDDENQKKLCRSLARVYAENNLSTDAVLSEFETNAKNIIKQGSFRQD